MADPVTLDQLRTLVAVVEEGNFSAAARKLRRVQSAVSTAMANLESQLGVPIWDRSTRVATLTEEGAAVLSAARRVLAEADSLVRLTSGMVLGVEARVSLCVDALYPIRALVDLCREFAAVFPAVDLRLDTEVLTSVSRAVLDGSATLGIASPLGILPGLEREVLAPVRMVPVVGARHPLAERRTKLSTAVLGEHVQIVLSERNEGVPDQAVLSPRTWRVVDLSTKHALLLGGLGWGNLPEHLVRDDLARGRLIEIRPAAWRADEHVLSLSAVYRSDTTFGPAHRWMLQRMGELCAREVEPLHRARRSRKRRS
jgi:DNA-binding transcriptional LysR family regulator